MHIQFLINFNELNLAMPLVCLISIFAILWKPTFAVEARDLPSPLLFELIADTTKLWYENLPACPCTSPDYGSIQLNDGWAREKGNLKKYHPGAASSYRSYPVIKTIYGRSGQQCCYDSMGHLITSGSGAGTPDKIGVCRVEKGNGYMKIRLLAIAGHFFKDVKPWKKYMKRNREGWMQYNAIWKPDNRNSCD